MAEHKLVGGYLSQSDGSAQYSIGGTVVVASVYGPGDVKVSNRHHDKMHIDVCVSPKCGTQTTYEKSLEFIVHDIVEANMPTHLHPRTAIKIIIQIIQKNGPLLAAVINSACAALLDAGVEMKSAFAAVTCCVTDDEVILIDPSEILAKESQAAVTCIFGGPDKNLQCTQTEGFLSPNLFSKCHRQCELAIKNVFSSYRMFFDYRYKLYMNKE